MTQPGRTSPKCVHSVATILAFAALIVSMGGFFLLCCVAFYPDAPTSMSATSKFEVYQDCAYVIERLRNEWHFSTSLKGTASKKTDGSSKPRLAINLVMGWKVLMAMSRTLDGIAEDRVKGSKDRISVSITDTERPKLFASVIRRHVHSIGDKRTADFLEYLSNKLERTGWARRVNEGDARDVIASLHALDGFWRTFEERKELKNLRLWTLKLIAQQQDILKKFEEGEIEGDGWVVWSVLFFVVEIFAAAITSVPLCYGAFTRKPSYMIPFLCLQVIFVIYKTLQFLPSFYDVLRVAPAMLGEMGISSVLHHTLDELTPLIPIGLVIFWSYINWWCCENLKTPGRAN